MHPVIQIIITQISIQTGMGIQETVDEIFA